MKTILIFLLTFIIGYCIAQPNCSNNCTTCPGMKVCDTNTCVCQSSNSITLLQFTATPRFSNKTIKLEWITLTENNNEMFTVERSIDGINFISIGTKEGAGNSNVILEYSIIDNTPIRGVAYYRLKQQDYDGVYTYSNLIATQIKNAEVTKIEAYNVYGDRVSLLDINKIYLLYSYYTDGSFEVETLEIKQ